MNKEAPLPAAPSSALAVVGGADQSGLRVYNERLILSLVRRFGCLSKVEMARLTGLSVQSSTAIMNRLHGEGLLRREAPLRGNVGQPTIPMSLEPTGAFSIGLKIGRRSCDLVLVDFCGRVRRRAAVTFPYPTPEAVIAFVAAELPALLGELSAAERTKIVGLGVATPFELWKWAEEIGAPPGAMDAWRDFDVAAAVGGLCHCPVILFNDAADPHAPPNSTSAKPGGSAISSISSSARLSAAASF